MKTVLDFSKQFSRKMVLLAAVAGLLVCVVFPVIYFGLSLQDKKNQATIRGEVLVKSLAADVMANPDLWYLDVPKFVQVAGALSPEEGVDAIRVFDAQAVKVYEKVLNRDSYFGFTVQTPVRFNNQLYGFVELEYGLEHLLESVGAVLAGFFLLGLFLAVLIYIYPVRIVRESEQVVVDSFQRLTDSEARYHALMEQAWDAVLLCDTSDGQIVEANTRFTEKFGYELNDDGILNLFTLLGGAQDEITCYLATAQQNEGLNKRRTLFRHHCGALVSVEMTATLIRYRERSLLAVTLRDISEDVRREQEIRRDAEVAAKVQRSMLSAAESTDAVELGALFYPHSYVGGDLYFTEWLDDRTLLRGYLVDVTGHGLSTALHTSALHVMLRDVNDLHASLADRIKWLNLRAAKYFGDATFAGVIGFELDLTARQMRWVCAGIPEVYVNTKTVKDFIACPGLFIGVNEAEEFETHVLDVEEGDGFVFLTDGLTDLLKNRTDVPLDSFSEMVALLQRLAESGECRDDATAVTIKINS